MVDTGASVNVLPKKLAPRCTKTSTNLHMWNSTKVTPIGRCNAEVLNAKNGERYNLEFVVVNEDYAPLISVKAAQLMNLIDINHDAIDLVASVSQDIDTSDLFSKQLGSLPGTVSFKIDENVRPVAMAERRVPLSVRPKLKKELDRLVELGVIASVTKPTEWVSQICITMKKSGDMRICLDPRELNKCLIRERFTLPVLDEVLHEIGRSKFFTKVDLASGYWQCKLDDKSSFLTTFQTCFGRFRWLRLPFGLSVSAEIFQKKLLQALSGLRNTFCIADDVVIHGKDQEEHDNCLKEFFQRCKDANIALNKSKMELRKGEITFMGHKITKDGLQVDPEKVRAISEMHPPKNLEQLRRFLGVINFLSKFLPNMADMSQPLHNLLKKDVPWNWSTAQENAFQTLKKAVTDAPVLAYYNPDTELTLENNASQYGLGTALIQRGKPIAYASRTLSDTEQRYAQIEKEMLAVVYGLDKFRHYTYGRDVCIVTDHKPLISIVQKPLAKAPKRLQSLLLRAQEYNFTLMYKPGSSIPIADALSRIPMDDKQKPSVEHINNIFFLPVSNERLAQFRDATARDHALLLLKETILQGWPEQRDLLSPLLLPYYSYRDELVAHDGLILRGDRLLVPMSLRLMIKKRLHAGHMGINSCLRRARELVFWPGMSRDIREFIGSCDICASHALKQSAQPLSMHSTPNRPWERIACDLLTIEGRNYLVTVDCYSNFFEIDFLSDLGSSTVITKLKHHFARYGIPDIIKSDNGPQFSCTSFKEFCKNWSIRHETSSPGNSQSNGAAEAAVKIAKRLMIRSRAANEDPYLGLLNHRNTPTEGMQSSPAQRLMGRRTKTLIPTTLPKLIPATFFHTDEKRRMDEKRANMATRHLDNRTLKPLEMGQKVRIQPIQKGGKLWKEAVVTKSVNGRSYEVATPDGKTFRRNRQLLREATKPPQEKPANQEATETKDVDNTAPYTESKTNWERRWKH